MLAIVAAIDTFKNFSNGMVSQRVKDFFAGSFGYQYIFILQNI